MTNTDIVDVLRELKEKIQRDDILASDEFGVGFSAEFDEGLKAVEDSPDDKKSGGYI